MDPDVLERLATDRAVGALAPDVEHLLDAYLSVDAPSAQAADEIARTMQLARAALAEKQPSSMPAFPVAGFMQIERWRKRVRQFTYAVGLAACLMIGLGLGRFTAQGEVKPQAGYGPTIVVSNTGGDSAPVHQSRQVPELARSTAGSGDSGFWSVARLKQQREQEQVQSTNASEPAIRIQWPTWNRPT